MIVISGFLIKQFQLFSALSIVVEFSGFSAQLTRRVGEGNCGPSDKTQLLHTPIKTAANRIFWRSDHAQFNVGIPDCLFPDASLEGKKEILMHKLQMQSIWLLLCVYS